MLVAFWDQLLGNSTPRCSKAGLSGSPITASRISHSIWSKGCTPAVENRRSIERPCRPFLGLLVAVLDIELLLSQRLSGVTAQDRLTGRTEQVLEVANKGVSEALPSSHMVATPHISANLPQRGTLRSMVDDSAPGRGADGRASRRRARGAGERASAAKEAVGERAIAAKEATADAIAAVKPKLRGVSHEWAFFVSLGFGVALILLAKTPKATLAVAIYAVSLSALFGTSALYHRVNWKRPEVRQWMRRLDHSMIFFLIAGTYTPFALLVLARRRSPTAILSSSGSARSPARSSR